MFSQKVFKDPLYDYISIDSDICEKIIDSKYFQRLRRIEQTSMRCLYPSARHDRFIHSIGVYHLAKMAIYALKFNDKVYIECNEEDFSFLDDDVLESLWFSFEMAALLHDVCHSPFSHTLEDFYSEIYNEDEDGNPKPGKNIITQLFEEAAIINKQEKTETFNIFVDECNEAKPAPHEIASCILIFRQFRDDIEELVAERNKQNKYKIKVDYLFMARCILGALYKKADPLNDYKNCIIKLLNSAIDVDKLDYITRDSSVSGFANTLVDTKRLLQSLVFAVYRDTNTTTRLCLAFKKTAVGVIQNVVSSRNSLYTWIYSHHKVLYESYLVHEAVDRIAKQSQAEDKKYEFLNRFFSVKSVEDKLTCDADIWNLFLQHGDMPIVEELIQRNKQKKAIWKSFAEFQGYFNTSSISSSIGDYSYEQMTEFLKGSSDDIKDFKEYVNKFEIDGEKPGFVVKVSITKLANIEHNEILVYMNNKLYPFDAIFTDLYKKASIPPFFYIYCDKEIKSKLNADSYKLKNEFVEYIKKYDKFRLIPNK